MRVDHEIEALRSDKASQRQLRAMMSRAQADWVQAEDAGAIFAQLEAFSAGEDLHKLADLQSLVRDLTVAREFIGAWVRTTAKCLGSAPLAQLANRHHYADGFASMQLVSVGGAALSLSVYEEKDKVTEPRSTIFSDRETYEIVLYGSGHGAFYQRHDDSSPIARTTLDLLPGSMIRTLGDRMSRQIEWVKGSMTVLQLSRTPKEPGLSREISLETGQLLMQSSGNKRDSQQELAMAVLSAMNREDAAPVLADMTRSGPDHLRWEATRHTLSLDSQLGMAALANMEQASTDTLQKPAHQLLKQLRTSYPQLAQRKAA